MSDKTDYLENLFIEALFRSGSITGAQRWLAVYTAMPGEAGGGTECSYSGYARQSFGATPSSAFTAASGGSTQNAALLSFPPIVGSTINIVGIAIADAVSAGNLLYYKAFPAPIAFNATDVIQFPAGSVVISEL